MRKETLINKYSMKMKMKMKMSFCRFCNTKISFGIYVKGFLVPTQFSTRLPLLFS
jgi:RNase P subunit RPR2